MKKLILAISAFSFLLACEKSSDRILISDQVSKTQYYDDEIFNVESQGIYGKWEYLFKSGGFAGTKEEPEYDYLEVVKFGIYGKIKDNKVKEIGKLIINKQDDYETIIDFFPDDKYKTDYFLIQKVIRFQGNDTLILDDNYMDGYGDWYKRTR